MACHLQSAETAAAAGKPWAGDAIAALVRGGLGCYRLAHAESIAQLGLPAGTPRDAKPDSSKPHKTLRVGIDVMQRVSRLMTPLAARTLANPLSMGPMVKVSSPTLFHTGSRAALTCLHKMQLVGCHRAVRTNCWCLHARALTLSRWRAQACCKHMSD